MRDLVGLPAAELARLRAAIEQQPTLEKALRWGFQQAPPLDVSRVTTQDEYTHDLILPWRDGLVLVYDAT